MFKICRTKAVIYYQQYQYGNKMSINKQDQQKSDLLDEDNNTNNQEYLQSPLGSFNCKPEMNTASIQHGRQKVDVSTLTDQLICKCECDQIIKLKEKAHKSFMQVIQIQNLYKEEIEQLQEQYEERQKTQSKKFIVKEKMLMEKCKELEQQLDKNRQQKMCKCKILENHVLELSFQSPFIIQNIEEILPNIIEAPQQANQNDSTDTIQHLKEYIPSQNLGDQHLLLDKNLGQFIEEFRVILEKQENNPQTMYLFEKLEKNLGQVMQLVKILIDNAISSQQKYNKLYKKCLQGQSKYSKIASAYEASQKQTKFMAEHIRRISQDKIKIDKKCHQLEKNNKHLEETIFNMKKILHQKGFDYENNAKKDFDVYSSHHLRDSYSDDISISLKSIGQKTDMHRNNPSHNPSNQALMRMSNPVNKNSAVNTFKKKSTFLEKKPAN